MILIMSLVFFFGETSRAQKVMTVNGDTIVAITPRNLKTINGILVDYEAIKRQGSLKDSIISLDSVMLVRKDSIILFKDKERELMVREFDLKIKKQKRNIFIGGGIGILVGILTGLLIGK
jgi:hypothetical protein